jgi:uncharacterized membrane protein YhaH (DUF805 family)
MIEAAATSSKRPRLERAPFALAVTAVYLLSFASQIMLSPPVTSRLSVIPFVLAQAVLIGVWVMLHARRLRDAGRPSGTAIGVAMVYALEIVLLVILVLLIVSVTPGVSGGAGSDAAILQLLVVLYLLSLLSPNPDLGGLQLWMLGFTVLMFLPVVIALGYSIWAGTRPSLPRALS